MIPRIIEELLFLRTRKTFIFHLKEEVFFFILDKENFQPLLSDIRKTIDFNPYLVLELTGDVSKMEKEVSLIVQKLGELRDKLRQG